MHAGEHTVDAAGLGDTAAVMLACVGVVGVPLPHPIAVKTIVERHIFLSIAFPLN
jgi:hypothetical protein